MLGMLGRLGLTCFGVCVYVCVCECCVKRKRRQKYGGGCEGKEERLFCLPTGKCGDKGRLKRAREERRMKKEDGRQEKRKEEKKRGKEKDC